eukprot:3889196-Rhodomonas_salina.2
MARGERKCWEKRHYVPKKGDGEARCLAFPSWAFCFVRVTGRRTRWNRGVQGMGPPIHRARWWSLNRSE